MKIKYLLLAILIAISPMHLNAEELEEPMVTPTDSLSDESNTDNGVIAIDADYVALTEEIKNGTSDSYGENTVYYDGKFYGILTDALKAVYMSNTNDSYKDNVLYCKKNANVGEMTHGHVADNLTIYGNGAFVSGGERDLEIDTYSYSRTTGLQDSNNVFLNKEITVKVDNLDGIAAWGERNTDYTVNLEFNNCDAMQRVYFTNNANNVGVINIKLENCTFDVNGTSTTGASIPSHINTSVYSNSDGKIEINNCTFAGIQVGLNLNHKAAGTQTVKVSNTQFIDCGQGVESNKTYAAPIRIVSKEGSKSELIVNNVEFKDTDGVLSSNKDILLGDGRHDAGDVQGKTTLEMTNTKAEIMTQEKGYYDSTGSVTNSEQAVVTPVEKNQTVKADDDNHFIVEDAKPLPEVAENNKPSESANYDDGGPFTTDACGNVFDRWGNEVYHAPVCLNSQTNDSSYKLVNTKDK